MHNLKDILARNVPLLDFVNYICFLGLSLTTLYTANATAMAKLQPIMGEYAKFAPIAALAIALFIASIFDADLRRHFITACQVFTAQDWKQAKASLKSAAWFFLFLAILRLVLSGGATVISSIFVADGMVEDGDIAGLEDMLKEKEATKQTLALQLTQQVNDTRATAERNAQGLIDAAVTSAPARWQKLYRERNGWFMSQGGDIAAYLKRIRNAETEAQRIRNAAEKQAETLIATQRNALQREQTDASFSAVVQMKERQVLKAEETEWVIKLALWMVDFVLAVFAVLSSIWLAMILPHRPEYVMFRDETSATAIIREFFLSIWRIVKSYGVWVVSLMDSKAEKVVESVGATVTINGRTVVMQRRNVAQASTATPATNGATPVQQAQNNTSATQSSPVANGVGLDYNLVAGQLEKARRNVAAYKSKIRKNEGNQETNRRGLEKWEIRVIELEKQLQDFS